MARRKPICLTRNSVWVLLNAEGGHPGNDLQHAAIRRWALRTMACSASAGELHHPDERGDGVRARIVSSRKGELANGLRTTRRPAHPG